MRGGLMVRRHLVRTAALLVSVVALVALVASSATASGATGSGDGHGRRTASTSPITWLAAGDSYSAGRGLSTAAGPCARAVAGGALAYPLQAYGDLRKSMPKLAAPTFTACSGAVIANFFSAGDAEHLPEWRPPGTRYDLVTFTLGGNTVDFSGVITQCVIGAFDAVHASAPGHKCPEDSWVRQQIAQRLGAPYVAFLREVAEKSVVPGGNVVVIGYPDLIAAPTSWPASDRSADSCQGITEADATQLRGEAVDLNATIEHDVAVVNDGHPNGVHLSFLGVDTGRGIAPVSTPRNDPYLFGNHDLCGAGAAWLNGIDSADLSGSFHPSLPGNVAEGDLLAQVLPHLVWPS
jgi:hypothetical protein